VTKREERKKRRSERSKEGTNKGNNYVNKGLIYKEVPPEKMRTKIGLKVLTEGWELSGMHTGGLSRERGPAVSPRRQSNTGLQLGK